MMATTIATWGNSEAIRFPREILRKAGLSQGDVVDFDINELGHIEVIPQKTYRVGIRRRRITYSDLFSSYKGEPLENSDAWGDDSFVGAEKDAWSF